jgi:predicted RND superfamily exporter protein
MESLLNADVIKAAASSTLGILSLMCLILVIALTWFRDSPTWAKLSVFVLLFGGILGFGSAALRQQVAAPALEVTRQFLVGRWQVEQKTLGCAGKTGKV